MAALRGMLTIQYLARSAGEIFFFGKTTPYGKNFKNSVLKVSIASLIDVLCSNFVKFGRQGIGEVVHCGRRRKFGDVSCTECTGQGNNSEFISTVKWKLDN